MCSTPLSANLNKFDPIKGIETDSKGFQLSWDLKFKQIWPDQGDWNAIPSTKNLHSIRDLNKFDPIKGIETPQI